MYIDDILIYSKIREEHLAHLRKVFERTRQSQLCCKLKMCKFGRIEIKYLGYVIGGGTVSIDPSKMEAVKN